MSNFTDLIDTLGSETIRLLSDAKLPKIKPQSIISSGNIAIDVATSVGGYPRDRVVEVYGNESSGKSTLAAEACAEFNKIGLYAAYIDFEHAVDIKYFRALGVKPSLFALSQPQTGEEGLDLAIKLAESPECGIVVIDSIAAIITKQELEGDLDDSNVGATARLMGRFMRKIKTTCSVHNTLLYCINQNRDKIGVMFGSPNTQPGGRALKFFASMRIEVSRTGTNKDKGEALSNQTKVRVVKNKLGNPYGEAEFEIEFGKGSNKMLALLEASVTEGLIVKKGRIYSYDGKSIATSEEDACQWLKENPEEIVKLRRKILKLPEPKPKIEKEIKLAGPAEVDLQQSEEGGQGSPALQMLRKAR